VSSAPARSTEEKGTNDEVVQHHDIHELTVVATLTAGLCASMLTARPARAATPTPLPEVTVTATDLGLQSADLERGLEFIDEIPEAVLLVGDSALQHWVAETHPRPLREARVDMIGCTGAMKIQALGDAAAALGAELLGVAAVKQKCSS
jgi:hypothetical protein